MKDAMFSIPIYKYQISNWKEKKKKLLDLYNSIEKVKYRNVITNWSLNPSEICSYGCKIIEEELILFKEETNKNYSINSFWFQKYENNMDHEIHTHGHMGFSSVVFIEFDPLKHRSTTFVSPFSSYSDANLVRYSPDVVEGDIIFFPSNIMHYCPVNLSKKERIICSFNLKIEHYSKSCFAYS